MYEKALIQKFDFTPYKSKILETTQKRINNSDYLIKRTMPGSFHQNSDQANEDVSLRTGIFINKLYAKDVYSNAVQELNRSKQI